MSSQMPRNMKTTKKGTDSHGLTLCSAGRKICSARARASGSDDCLPHAGRGAMAAP